MKSLKTLASIGACLLIVGCKTTIETEVTVSDLLSSPTKQIAGALVVEVPACQDYQDSRKPSNTLIEVQKMVPTIFKDATFAECYRQQFNSFARFDLPLVLDKDKDGKLASEEHINILSNESEMLAVAVPAQIKAGLEDAAKRGPGSALNMRMKIKVVNDTGADVSFNVVSAFVDDEPYVFGSLISKADQSFTVTLSDVSVQSAVNGDAMVLRWRK